MATTRHRQLREWIRKSTRLTRGNRSRQLAHKALNIESLEERRVLAGGPVLAGVTGDDGALLLGGEIKNISPRALTLTFDRGQAIDTTSLNGIIVRRSGLDGGFTQGNEVAITPGFIGLGSNPNEIVIRFASTLPDDVYQLTIKGTGTTPLKNTAGQPFNMGVDHSQTFELDLGAKVVSVVPQPITRDATGRLSQARNRIDVYFTNDDLNPTLATNPAFYRLFMTGHANQFDGAFDTVSSGDDGDAILPTSVSYDPVLDRAILTFRDDLAAIGVGTMRLRIGSDVGTLPVPLRTTVAADPGSSFATANVIAGTLGAQDQIIVSSIDPQFLPVVFPGSNADPGHRQVNTSFDFHVFDGDRDTVNGISTLSYNFRTFYGRDGSGSPLRNAITEFQKQRAREAFELWGNSLGVKFVETALEGFTIATGDLRAIDPTAFTDPDLVQGAAGEVAGSDPAGVPFEATAVMNGAQRWNDGFGENWFQEAMRQIGHLLGLGAASDLPAGTVMSTNTSLTFGREGELVFPGNHDIVHGQYLYRPDGIDIDMYQVNVDQDGILTAETLAERLTSPSGLDSYLRLYRRNGNAFELVAQNDDYFSQDSLVSVPVTAGTYYVGVTSKGNDKYNPTVVDTGAGGTTQGNYELRLHLEATGGNVLRDTTGIALDGDADNLPGGDHNFWFRSQTSARTLVVDKAASTAGSGTLTAPFNNLRSAMQAAGAGDIVRVVGNNFLDADLRNDRAYELGFATGNLSQALPDSGANGLLEVKKGVTLMVDAGAVFKLQGSSIIVGSTSSTIDRSGAALQLLGIPGRPVRMTSYNDETIGNDTTPLPSSPRSGDWGGILFRNDIDASLNRFEYEDQGIFLNTVSNTELAYGGGFLTLDSVVGAANPITMIDARPAVAFNLIRQSADAAMSASPDSFEETRFTVPRFQTVPFTPEYGRVGPELHDNQFLQNTTNALFVGNRFSSVAGGDILTGSARWDDIDVVHVVADNLRIAGNSGGLLKNADGTLQARLDGRLAIDPGMIVKLEGSYIDVGIGATILAEGTATQSIVFTSIQDDRFGAGGSFDTNGDGVAAQQPVQGDWGGIYLRPASRASLDRVLVAYGGGITPIEGSFTGFNAVEAHQADLRVTRSTFEFNALGVGGAADASRAGRTVNAAGTIYVSGAQPVILQNRFLNNDSSVINIDVNSLSYFSVVDAGRQTGGSDRITGFKDNQGPLVRENVIGKNGLNAMEIRGGTTTTEVVWDDTDIVHVLRDGVFIPNFHTFGGVRLKSAVDQSLVIKLSGPQAGFTTTGSASGIPDHIGGSLQVIGQPGYPVVMTSLFDDSVGAGFDSEGITQTDTNGGGRPTRKDNSRPFQIDFNFGPNISQNAAAVAAIRRAADAWEEELSDPMTVVIDIELGTFRDELFTGTEFSRNAQLLQTTIDFAADLPYATVRNAMIADAGAHESLVADLPNASELSVTLPDESLGAFGLSDNMRLTRANAKALQLATGTGNASEFDSMETRDASILVNANLDLFDLDRKDGLLSYREDFQTQLMRDIGSILGFGSGVDQVTNALAGSGGDGEIQMYPLDLFRFAPGDGATDFTNSPRLLDPREPSHVFYAGNQLDYRSLPFQGLAMGDIPLATGFRRAGELNDAYGAGFWRDDLPLREEEAELFPTIGLMDPASFLRDEILYELDPTLSTAGVLVNISEADRLGFDSIGYDVVGGAPGDWQGIRLEKLTHDGNVAIVPERETPESPTNTNSSTFNAEFLGQLAPNEKSGDENIRLGFEIQGTISQPSDVDVFSFRAKGGTTVYLDIDRTGTNLDSILELISPDGTVVAGSDDSLSESTDPSLLVGSALPLDSQDIYTTNPRDAAMKVILPGATGVDGTYHVRVRSFSDNLADLAAGTTEGSYQLQIRLQSEDEVPGASIQLADIRFAETGITVVGPPSRSSLGGEQTEDGSLNDVIAETDVIIVDDMDVPISPAQFVNHLQLPYDVTAQNLGNVLATRQGATSVFGRLASFEDVDWYRVEFVYEDLQASFAQSFFNPDVVGVAFDIDYADGFGRPDTTLSVFNEAGQLIFFSESSNVAADQPGTGGGADLADLSRGSAGTKDPFIGPVVLAAGRELGDFGAFGTAFGTGIFYVAVSSALYAPDPVVNGTAVRTPIGTSAAERGERITGTQANDSLFSLKTPFPPGAITDGEYSLEIRLVDIPNGGFVGDAITVGDQNRKREQGLISISSNQITNSREWGIRMVDSLRDLPSYPGDLQDIFEDIDPIQRFSDEFFTSQPHTQFSTGDYIPHAGAPRLLPTVNEERQLPGLTISNNVIAGGLEGGIELDGDGGGVVLTLYDLNVFAADLRAEVIAGSEFTLWDHSGKSATFQFEPAAPGNIPIRWDLDPDNDGGDVSESFATSVGGPTLSQVLADEIEHAIRRSDLDVRVFQNDATFGRRFGFGDTRLNSTLFIEGVSEIGHPDIFGGRNSVFIQNTTGEDHPYPYLTADFVQQGAVPYVRVVNNTLVGRGGTSLSGLGSIGANNGVADVGILLEDNVSPTLLNNIIANFGQGIRSDQTSTDANIERKTFIGTGYFAQGETLPGNRATGFRVVNIRQSFLDDGDIPLPVRLAATGHGLDGGRPIDELVVFNRNLLDVDRNFTDYQGNRPTVIGATIYQGNLADTVNVGRGDNAIRLANSAALFVDAADGNYYLQAGSRAIDSSVDRLAERTSLNEVLRAVGIDSAGILAPSTDASGAQRVDDPSVEPPSGLGQNVFKDRGALERADFVGPLAAWSKPIDNDSAGLDRNPNRDDIAIFGTPLGAFDLRFSDGATPSNPTFGSGADDSTVSSAVVKLFRDDTLLVAGVDYAVTYDVAADLLRLTANAGVWQDGQYRIELDNTMIRDRAGNLLQANRTDGKTAFNILLGQGFDFGDAPSSYKTLLPDDGARHQARGGLFLGGAPTLEADGLPDGDADGDLGDDGVTIPGRLQPGTTSTITVEASQAGFLNAWVDLNADGDFDISDKIATAVPLARGTNQVQVLIPATAVGGSTYARFRFSSIVDLLPTGPAPDGEVEDYLVSVGASNWQNPDDRYDVNDDNVVAPLDALLVINELNDRTVSDETTGALPTDRPATADFLDVNGDGFVSPLDALLVINQLPSGNNRPGAPGGLVVWNPEALADEQQDEERAARLSAVDAVFASSSSSTQARSGLWDATAQRRKGKLLPTGRDLSI